MSAAALAPAGRATPVDVLALQYGSRAKLLLVPLIIVGSVVVISVLVAVAILRAGGDVGGTTWNSGIAWALPGYLISVGVQNVTASYPFALALGSTRRAFVLGNLLTSLTTAVYVATVGVVLLGVEAGTDGFFIGAHVFRVNTLGEGDPLVAFVVLLLGTLTSSAVGGVFGAAWTRFGPVGPTVLGLGLALLAAVALVALLPSAAALLAGFRPWWLAAVAAAVTAASLVGQHLLLRGASVR